jgi:hypothetical protein
MIRKLLVSLTAGFIAAASLPAGSYAEQAPPPELVKEIQSRLFDLGYMAWPDGKCAKAGPGESCVLYAAVCADGSSQTGVLENKP